MRIALRCVLILLIPLCCYGQSPVPDYKNPKLAVEQRVADLLKRMTLEERRVSC